MLKTTVKAILLIFSLSLIQLPANAATDDIIRERPTMGEMGGDLLLRPVFLTATVVGSALFVVGAPFSILGGNFGESFNVLVAEPFSTTFFRCLGCKDRSRAVKRAKQ